MHLTAIFSRTVPLCGTEVNGLAIAMKPVSSKKVFHAKRTLTTLLEMGYFKRFYSLKCRQLSAPVWPSVWFTCLNKWNYLTLLTRALVFSKLIKLCNCTKVYLSWGLKILKKSKERVRLFCKIVFSLFQTNITISSHLMARRSLLKYSLYQTDLWILSRTELY